MRADAKSRPQLFTKNNPKDFRNYAFGAAGALGAPGVVAAGAAGAAGAGTLTPSREAPHSEHTVAVSMFISPQCGHWMRSSGSSAPHLTHFSATAGLIMPHSGQVLGLEAAAGLKHMMKPSFWCEMKPTQGRFPEKPTLRWLAWPDDSRITSCLQSNRAGCKRQTLIAYTPQATKSGGRKETSPP